jgi:predicted TIM-barrel fold metal-dependent hydrolase
LNEDLAPYFEQPWRRVLEEGGLTREGARNVKGERLLDYPGYSPLTPYDPILGELPAEEPHRITVPDGLRADLAARGVGGALLFTGRLLRAATSNDEPYVAQLMRAYNRMLAERWVDPASGSFAAIMAANQVPEEAAEEIARYAGVPGFAAVYLPTAGNYPLWGDRSYEPIFAAAEGAGLPVVLQGALTIHTVFPYELHHLPTALAKQALSQPFGALANLTSLIATGALARHPDLKLVVNDAGLAWLPLLSERLDHFYPYLKEEVPELTEKPSAYLRRQVYVTTHPLGDDPTFARACLDAIGEDHVLFGSDWPHFDADAPSRIEALPISEEAKRKILGENAGSLFRVGN